MTGEGMRMQAIFVGEFFPNLMEGQMTFIRPAFSILRTIRDPLGADLYTPPLHEISVPRAKEVALAGTALSHGLDLCLMLYETVEDTEPTCWMDWVNWNTTIDDSRLPPYQCHLFESSDQPTEVI
jgi:hypothetical protein